MPVGLTAPAPTLTAFRRLDASTAAPVALALSGGGDSMALLRLAKPWADRRRRRLIALTVDHGLQPGGAEWARFAGAAAARNGVEHRILRWEGPKPDRGLPAAARAARHALLAEAARRAGALVILMGHTADDLAETVEMRRAGASTPSPKEWAPSPAWPEGRGVFLLRPLLGQARAELRDLLERLGEAWIEDPANDDPRFFRTLARRRLAGANRTRPIDAAADQPWGDLDLLEEGQGGDLVAPRAALAKLEDRLLRRVVAVLATSAAGSPRPAPAAGAGRLASRLRGEATFIATLGGARVEASASEVRFCREAGERVRAGLAEADLPAGESVFDGRFAVRAPRGGYRIGWLTGRARRLPRRDRALLDQLPPCVRGALPAVFSPDGEIICPALGAPGPVSAQSLSLWRAKAALGAFNDERSLCA